MKFLVDFTPLSIYQFVILVQDVIKISGTAVLVESVDADAVIEVKLEEDKISVSVWDDGLEISICDFVTTNSS